MEQRAINTPEEVRKFAPKRPRDGGDSMDESGQAVLAMLQKAADLSNDNCDRAMSMAHKLSIQLRAAEDQISQLQAENVQLRDRAERAETWLAVIQKEIEEKLLAPRPGRPKM
jgi:predicted  nucleic acid-binding Zn-ribbon protein